jgi:hypothetical protein
MPHKPFWLLRVSAILEGLSGPELTPTSLPLPRCHRKVLRLEPPRHLAPAERRRGTFRCQDRGLPLHRHPSPRRVAHLLPGSDDEFSQLFQMVQAIRTTVNLSRPSPLDDAATGQAGLVLPPTKGFWSSRIILANSHSFEWLYLMFFDMEQKLAFSEVELG